MKNGQRSHHAGLTVHRHRINVHRLAAQLYESLGVLVLRDGLGRRGGRVSQLGRQTRAHRQRLSVTIIDRQPVETLPLSKLFNQPLESSCRSPLENRFNDFFQALRQQLRAPVQVVLEPLLLNSDLAAGEKERDDGDA